MSHAISEQQSTPDHWVKIIASGLNLKASALTARDAVQEAQDRHRLSGRETIALGEAILAAALLASRRKPKERVSLSLKGDGFLKQSIVDSTPEGAVRGFVIVRESHRTPLPDEEKLNREFGIGPWGEGFISVATLLQNQKEPYIGNCQLATGHLAKDLTFYLSQSEQIPAAVGLAVNLDEQGKVSSAGGFLIEVMPGANEQDLKMIENNLKGMHGLTNQIAGNSDPTFLLSSIFTDLAFSILDKKNIYFGCHCSKERIKRALRLLDSHEIQDMIEKDKGAQVRCDYCNTEYKLSIEDLENLLT